MESGYGLYYARNTVEPPRPSQKRLKKNAMAEMGEVIMADRQIEHSSKVCATYQCVWCGITSETPTIICKHCHNCQYCGQYQGSGYDHECIRCGNHLS